MTSDRATTQDKAVEADVRAAAAAAQPDAFMSYAREDEAFVQTLGAALAAGGKELWIDREDIPYAADWRARARAGIEASKAVVFVLSEHWLDSQSCRFELDHAVASSKRLVPVALRPEVDAERLPAALRDLSWIAFTEDLGGEVAQLIATLDDDLAWRDTHARLLVRAVEWDAKDRDKSLLLRGGDLREAERWLEDPGEHAEQVTTLHSAYLSTSRRVASRRQWIALALVVAALLISLVLGGLAYWQRGVAIDNERTAVKNGNDARSRELAATATAQLPDDPELALLLGVEAAKAAPTVQAAEILRAALPQTNAGLVLPHRGLGTIDVSRDGRRAITGGSDGLARLWDLSTGRRSAVLRGHSAVAMNDSQQGVIAVDISDDGAVAATAGAEGGVRVWDAADGRLLHAIRGRAAQVADVALAAGGRLLVIGDADGTIRVVDAATGTPRAGARLPDTTLADLLVSPDGRRVAAAGLADTNAGTSLVGVWDATTLRPISRMRTTAFDLAFSPDGRRLATSADGTVRIWNADTGAQLRHVATDRYGGATAFAPDGRRIAVALPDGIVAVQDVSTGRDISRVRHGGLVAAVAFSRDGTRLATSGSNETARVWDIAARRLLQTVRGHRSGVWYATFLGTGDRLLTAGGDDTARIWRPAAEATAHELLGHRAVIDELALSPDGTRVATASEDGTARIWDVASGRLRATVDHGNDDGNPTVAFSPDGRRLLTAGFTTARVWNAANGRATARLRGDASGDAAFASDARAVVARSGLVWDATTGRVARRLDEFGVGPLTTLRGDAVLGAHFQGPVSVESLPLGTPLVRLRGVQSQDVAHGAFSPDGRDVAIATSDGVGIWDVRSGMRTSRVPLATTILAGVPFDRRGGRLLTATATGVRLWDVERRRLIADLPHAVQVGSAAFSPNGQLVVTASYDGFARVWEARTGRLIARFRGRSSQTWNEGFEPLALMTPDSQTVATATGGSTAFVHRCAICAPLRGLLDQARQATSRRLTADERLAYLGG